jgi:hypothetical protein
LIPLLAFEIAEDSRRQRARRRDAAAVHEDRDELLLVDGDRQRLPQLRRRLAEAADDRIEHVETHVEDRRAHAGQQADPLVAHLVGQLHVTATAETHRLVEAVGGNPRRVVIALQELVPVGNALFLARKDACIDER